MQNEMYEREGRSQKKDSFSVSLIQNCYSTCTRNLLWFLLAGVVAVSMTEALEGFVADFIELLAPMEL